jgi:hypothetical protein
MRRVLRRFAGALSERGIEFQLGGSGLLFALGLLEEVGDLDIVFPPEAGEALGPLLEQLSGVPPRFDAEQERGFVSAWRCRHELDGESLDLSGGVTLEIEGRRTVLPFRTGSSWDLDGEPIPLAPLEQWLMIYRHHNPERATLLEPLVDPESWHRLMQSLGPG